MLKYARTRVLLMLPSAVLVLVIVFILGQLSPIDAVDVMVRDRMNRGIQMTPEQVERMREQYGFERPIVVQFLDYAGQVVRGDLGNSYFGGASVVHILRVSLPVSAQLALGATLLLLVVGIPLGVLAALRQNTWVDYLIVGTAIFLRSIPIYVLGPIMLIVLVLHLDVMDVPRGFPGILHPASFAFIVLLALSPLAVVIRQTRAGVLEALSNDYIRTARAKGLPTRTIIVRHVLRNALIPVITSVGLIINGLIIGSVFLDNMFNIPGFGRVFTQALTQRDFAVIYGAVVATSFLTMAANLLVDLLYPVLDPRVKYE
jgi:ABC-type dipeptide/oligopeptide/nickel transport system permease component